MFWFYLCLGMVILAALLLTAGVCIWVYQDAKERGERAWLWVLIILISSPLLGGLVYLIARREERRPCRFCGWMLERDSHYCSHCGKQFPFCEPGSGYKEDLMPEHPKQKKRNRRYLVLTTASAVMMVLSLVGMIFFAVHSSGWEPEWNSGWVMMNLESNSGGSWSFRYSRASENYHTSSRFTLEDPQRQKLAVDLQFEQGEWMRMQITQQTRDGRTLERESRVTSDENIQYFSLEGFEEGTIKVRFYNNGVSGVKAQVRVA